jgi:hypothetical protein
MIARVRSHLTYANVVSSLCLFILLGGSAYAAATIGSAQIKNNSIQGKDVKNRSLTRADLKRGSLPAGPRGARGATGPKGPAGTPGAPATRLFAAVGSTGNLLYGSGVTGVTRQSTGVYTVAFNRPMDGCVGVASPGLGTPATDGGTVPGTATGAQVGSSGPSQLRVTIETGGGIIDDSAFQLAVFC